MNSGKQDWDRQVGEEVRALRNARVVPLPSPTRATVASCSVAHSLFRSPSRPHPSRARGPLPLSSRRHPTPSRATGLLPSPSRRHPTPPWPRGSSAPLALHGICLHDAQSLSWAWGASLHLRNPAHLHASMALPAHLLLSSPLHALSVVPSLDAIARCWHCARKASE